MSITPDVTVDYNVPLPCGLVSFPRVRTLATLEAGGDGELLDLSLPKLANQKHTHSPPVCLKQLNKIPVKVVNTASSYR